MHRRLRKVIIYFGLLCILFLTSCKGEEIKEDEYPPAVMFQNCIYGVSSGLKTGWLENELIKVGEITSYTTDFPTENNQANDDLVGCSIYVLEGYPNHILISHVDEDGMRHYSTYVKK